MKITQIEIQHWRSVKHLKIACQDLIVLLGPNNHGKSNVLSAIGFVLSVSEKPSPDDFFSNREVEDGNSDELWVELTFKGLTDQERSTFKKYIGADGYLRVRKTAVLDGDEVTVRYNGWLSQPRKEWLRSDYKPTKAELQQELESHLPQDIRFSAKAVALAQQAYIEVHKDELTFDFELETGPFLGTKNVAAGTLPEWFLIPAVRDLTDETKTKSTATFGRLLTRAVQEMTAHDPKVREVREKLEEMVDHLNAGDGRPSQLTELEQAIQEEMKGWEATLRIQVQSPNIAKVFELGTSLIVDDGVVTTADRKGNGMQRALLFALTQAWVRALREAREARGDEAKPRSGSNTVILAIEEPELYLHPHAERKLHRNLVALAEADDHQVFLSTHSTHFVDLDRPRSICIIHKPEAAAGTQARQCGEELFADNKKKQFNAAYWVNPNRGEMLFARRVAFVEGATEATLFPFLAEKLNCFDPEVSVIDCGGKFNLPLYVELARAFGLDFIVVYDEDPVKEGLEGDKLETARRTFAYNQEIVDLVGDHGDTEMVSPDVEGIAEVPKGQGQKVGKPLAAIEHFSRLGVDVPARLEEIVRAIYRAGAA